MLVFLSLLIGLLMLVTGAEFLVRGGGKVALALRIPALVVGLTVVAFGTSSPELAVSVSAALEASPEVALANVTGSNIANILLVLGMAALVRPLVVERTLMRREIPVLLGVTLLLPLLLADGWLGTFDGVLLILVAVGYNVWLIGEALSRRSRASSNGAEANGGFTLSRSTIIDIVMLLGGMAILVFGAHIFVDASTDIAVARGWSDRFVGLTIIALGTSAPELATAMVSAYKGEVDLAIGNSIGSNILNISMVLGVTCIIAPIELTDAGVWGDLAVVGVSAFLLVPVILVGGRLGRTMGGVMVLTYVLYLALTPHS